MKAKQLSPEDIYKLLQEISAFNATCGEAFLEMGVRWLTLNRAGAHKTLGLKSFNELIASYTHYSRSYVYFCMAIAEKFGKLLLEDSNVYSVDIDFSRLRAALPFVLDEETAQEWIDKARSLPPEGYTSAIQEAKGKIPQDACLHDGETSLWERCEICQKWLGKIATEKE